VPEPNGGGGLTAFYEAPVPMSFLWRGDDDLVVHLGVQGGTRTLGPWERVASMTAPSRCYAAQSANGSSCVLKKRNLMR
jgi:hypothetical protein